MMEAEELTLLDLYVAPFWEVLYLYDQRFKSLNLKENAPKICSYIEKFRNHPQLKSYCLPL